ncbi:MAG: magnesium transporter [Micrococcales bacterium]|nr:magnesium transporter [Micrococcales bacterium]
MTVTRAFIARLHGSAVFDPNGEQLGKVRDFVVILRHGAQPPRVVGLVVEVGARRRIFLPITRVTKFDAGQIVSTGVLDLRRFKLRPGETLAVGELFDRTVEMRDTGERVKILDLAMQQNARRDWEIAQAYVRGGRGLTRRGQTRVVPWRELTGLSVSEPDQATETMLESLADMRPADVASVLHDLPEKRRLEIARALDDERLADVLEEMAEHDAVQIMSALESERAADVLEEMDPDDAVDLLSDLSPEQARQLLELVEPEDAEDLRRLLSYDELSAGGMMSPDPVIVGADATVAEALAQIRNPDLSPALASQVYVVRPPMQTPTGKFLGVVHWQRLLREPPSDLVSRVIDKDLAALPPETPLATVTRYFAAYNLVAVPIVDPNGHLLGAVTVDDLLDHLLGDNWREESTGVADA